MALTAEERDNLPRWHPGQKGFFETYDLTWVDPAEKLAGWFRFGLSAPQTGSPEVSLWVTLFDPKNAPLSLKQTFPLHQARIETELFFFSIGSSALFQSGSHGELSGNGHALAWEFHFEAPSSSFRHLPSLLYRLPFPATKLLAPHLSCRISGHLTVDGREISLHAVPAHQAHLWGSSHPPFWTWGHCNSFREDPTAVFEGFSSVLSLAGKMRIVTLLYLTLGGQRYSFAAPWHLLKNRSRFDLTRWNFGAEGKGVRLMGEFRADPKTMVGLKYQDPDRSLRFCHHTEAADLRIEVMEGEKSNTLTAVQTATYETATGRPDPRITFF